jgi:hypothetical protein
LRQFDRVLVTSGLRPIPDKRIGTSQDVAMAKRVGPRFRDQQGGSLLSRRLGLEPRYVQFIERAAAV